MADLIERSKVIDVLKEYAYKKDGFYGIHNVVVDEADIAEALKRIPSVKSERDIPKRIHWIGLPGYRDTKYRCPACSRSVRIGDVYCHTCGQRLMFPKISRTPYKDGQMPKVIVRWGNE